MSLLSRLTTWTAGQLLKSADLNGEFNNIVNGINNLDAATTTWTNVKAATVNATTDLQVNSVSIYKPVTSYTPNYSAGWGTVSNSNVHYTIVGRQMHMWGIFQCGTVAASAGQISIPYNLDSSIYPANGRAILGHITNMDAVGPTNLYPGNTGYLIYDGVSADKVTFSFQTGSNSLLSTNVSAIVSTNQYVTFDMWVQLA